MLLSSTSLDCVLGVLNLLQTYTRKNFKKLTSDFLKKIIETSIGQLQRTIAPIQQLLLNTPGRLIELAETIKSSASVSKKINQTSPDHIFYNLIEASNYLKIYVNLCRTGGIDVHQLFIETWSSDERKLVLEVLFSTFTIIFCKHDNLADELSSTVPMLRIELEEYIARVYKQPF